MTPTHELRFNTTDPSGPALPMTSDPSQVDAFLISIVINGSLGLMLVILFLIVHQRIPWIYSPRSDDSTRQSAVKPPELGDSFVFSTVLRTPESKILQSSGPDALIFARFFHLCAVLFLFASVLGCIMLIVNLNGGNNEQAFNQLSLSNIANDSHTSMLHIFSVWAIHLFALFLMFRAWIGWVSMRHAYLSNIHSIDQNLTILASNIPKSSRNDEALGAYFQRLYPHNFHSAVCVKDMHRLHSIVERRLHYLKCLEHAYGVWGETGERQMVKEKKSRIENALLDLFGVRHSHSIISTIFAPFRDRVDAIEYYTYKLNKYNSLVATEQARLPTMKPKSTAFITFKSALVANTAVRVEHNARPFQYVVKPAPLVHDVYWPALMLNRRTKLFRSTAVAIIITFALIFWSFPVAFVNSLSHLDSLTKYLPFLDSFVDTLKNYNILLFVEGYLPSLALMLLMLILPIILKALCRWQGIESHSWIEKSLLEKYFLFQIFNFFVINALASSFLTILLHLQELSPSDLLGYLSRGIPAVAPFFINFIMLRSLTGFPMQLARLWPLFWGIYSLRFRSRTERERREIQQPPTIDYGEEYPEHLLIFTVGVTYAAIAPVVLPFIFLYFFLGYCAKVYQSLYMYVPLFESGGMLWPSVFQRMTFSLMLSQFTMIGVFTLRGNPVATALLVPLPVITIAVNRYVWHAYWLKGCYLPVEIAEEVDRKRKAASDEAEDIPEEGTEFSAARDERKEALPEYTAPSVAPAPVDRRGSRSVTINMQLESPLRRQGALPEDSDVIQRSESDIARKAKRQSRHSQAWGTGVDFRRSQGLSASPSNLSINAPIQESPHDTTGQTAESLGIEAVNASHDLRRPSLHPSVHIHTASIKSQQESDRQHKETLHPYTQPELLEPIIVVPDIDAELRRHASYASVIDAALAIQSAQSPSSGSSDAELSDSDDTGQQSVRVESPQEKTNPVSRWKFPLTSLLASGKSPVHRDRSVNVSVDASTALLSSPHHELTAYSSADATSSNSSRSTTEKKKKKKLRLFNTNEEWDQENEEDDDV